eukprot:m.128116 g.128116  ORF g.128116 m.128116 type:complete len:575 (+) comp13864_c0_seq2:512-2236(+)
MIMAQAVLAMGAVLFLAAHIVQGAVSFANEVKTQEEFLAALASNGRTMVAFFTPWCSKCNVPSVHWQKVVDSATRTKYSMKFISVNCANLKVVCRKHAATTFPKFMMFPGDGDHTGVLLEQPPTHQALIQFIREALVDTQPPPPLATSATISEAPTSDDISPKRIGAPNPVNDQVDNVIDAAVSVDPQNDDDNDDVTARSRASRLESGAELKQAQVQTDMTKDKQNGKVNGMERMEGQQEQQLSDEQQMRQQPNNHEALNDQQTIDPPLHTIDASVYNAIIERVPCVRGLYSAQSPEQVDALVSGPLYAFVKFYAPWCGQCTKMAPAWEALAQQFEHSTTVRIVEVDCTEHTHSCDMLHVTSYPSLQLFKGGIRIAQHKGSRDLTTLANFVNQQTISSQKSPEQSRQEQVAQQQLTSNDIVNLDTKMVQSLLVSDGRKGQLLITAYAPWCPFSAELLPVLEQVNDKQTIYLPDRTLNFRTTLAQVDCTQHPRACQRLKVTQYPTVQLYRGNSKIADFTGSRDLESILQFLQSNTPAWVSEPSAATKSRESSAPNDVISAPATSTTKEAKQQATP